MLNSLEEDTLISLVALSPFDDDIWVVKDTEFGRLDLIHRDIEGDKIVSEETFATIALSENAFTGLPANEYFELSDDMVISLLQDKETGIFHTGYDRIKAWKKRLAQANK